MFPSSPLVGLVAGLVALWPLATTAGPLTTPAAPAPATDWKVLVGWNKTVLPASVFGTSIGAFTPPPNASPAPAVSQNLAASDATLSTAIGKPGGVFICQDGDWKGLCGYAVQPLNECILLVSPWLDTISSFGPDPGATCFGFSSNNCDAGNAQWSFTFPGDDTGGSATTNPWNDKITNFACTAS
ncbi:hypothetical protein C8R44DRAFT_813175 [Mycena epipterygia]|nr:hypothetical protein C8R44DRAFT_813175 [Mycena epipterygia]